MELGAKVVLNRNQVKQLSDITGGLKSEATIYQIQSTTMDGRMHPTVAKVGTKFFQIPAQGIEPIELKA